MSRPEFDNYRKYHEDVSWHELELEFDEDAEFDFEIYRFLTRLEEERLARISQNAPQSDVALGGHDLGRSAT